jgi:hypothetical protein
LLAGVFRAQSGRSLPIPTKAIAGIGYLAGYLDLGCRLLDNVGEDSLREKAAPDASVGQWDALAVEEPDVI